MGNFPIRSRLLAQPLHRQCPALTPFVEVGFEVANEATG